MTPPFSPRQLDFFRSFAEAMYDRFDMAIPLERVVENFVRIFEPIHGEPRDTMRWALTLWPLVLKPDFKALEVSERRQRIIDKLIDGNDDRKQDFARLKALTYAAYYGHWLPGDEDGNRDNPVHAQIGFTLPKFRYRAPTEPQLTQRMGHEIDPTHVLLPSQVEDEYDYIVVGSGSGGATAAHNLAPFGKVLVIEAGPFVPSPAITFEERRMGAMLFKDGALQSTEDKDIVIFQGRVVGGSPVINNGICLRMAGDPLRNAARPDPYQRWIDAGADVGRARLDAAYAKIIPDLELDHATDRAGQGNGHHLIDGWTAFAAGRTEDWIAGAKPGWFPKNVGPEGDDSSCASAGYCNTGCRFARKRDMARTYLPQACTDHGARILPDSEVVEITWDKPGGGRPWRATGAMVKVGGDDDECHVRARKGLVVAAGTIASSVLLKDSGIKNRNLGKGISLNVASPVVALMPDDGRPPAWDESQMTTAVDCGDFWLESHFQPPMSMAMLLGGWFEEMDRRMKLYGRMRSAGVLLPLDRRGKLDGDKLEFKFRPPVDHALLRRALATLTKVHFHAGALEVWPSIRANAWLTRADVETAGKIDDAKIDAFYARHIVEKDDATLSSAHPHGGNAMHPHPDHGVVDMGCKVHGTENLLVTDASVFPACIGVNAQYTVMAIAHLATEADPVTGKPPI